ncbi:MAG: phosphate butyryltransferase [Clostridiales bacterium]|jgi:phosphate butyryltransferase|nr:phosphate butyryltransferase [Clostridiales bacterium]
MIYSSYAEVLEQLKDSAGAKIRVSVAAAADWEILDALKYAGEQDLAQGVLVGDEPKILELAQELDWDLSGFEIIHQPDHTLASRQAVAQIRLGRANSLMKGLVNTSDFMRAVLDKEEGIRGRGIVSHLSVLEIPGCRELLFISDAGIIVAPTLDEKKQILNNALDYMRSIGYDRPKVAVVAANEQVSPKNPVTVEARQLQELAEQGEFGEVDLAGPYALDIAVDKESAKLKGIEGPVAGQAQLLLVPNIEAGNLLAKSLLYYAGATMAGLVLGAKVPIVVVSRAAAKDFKIVSLAMSALPSLRDGN